MPHRVSTCGSSLPPSTMYTTCFDASLRVENPCRAPQLPSDTIRACKCGISPHRSPFNGSASCVTQTEAYSTIADLSGHLPPTLVLRTMRIALLSALLGDNHPPPPTTTRLCALDTTKAVLASSRQILMCVCLLPLSLSTTCSPVSSPTQDEVYEGVGDPTIFSLTCTSRTRLPAHRHTTAMTTYSPVLLPQTAIVNTSTCVPPLASQDGQIELSSSVVTDVSVDTQASVGEVSLANEITSVSNPIWVKCAATMLLVAGATLSSSEISFGVEDSHSHHQDFCQE